MTARDPEAHPSPPGMTHLEGETFADGFRVGLLCGACTTDRSAYEARIFDGGRVVHEERGCSPPEDPAAHYLRLRSCLSRVCAAPHVLVGCGAGWGRLVEECLAGRLGEYRLLDLHATATALAPGLPPRATARALAQAYGIVHTEPDDGPPVAWYEELLWAVIRKAGRQAMDWPALLRAAGAAITPVGFERYAFDALTLAALPDAPGVYLMRNAASDVLYVGKSGSLRRRLNEYFRGSRDVPQKLRELRDRIYDVEWRVVGSELEALLVEHRLIERHEPPLNVQRVVAEGRSRYIETLIPVVLFEASATPRRIELFFFAPRLPAAQLRLDIARPPRRQLADLVAFYRGERARLRRSSSRLTDWGGPGREICHRYFSRARSRLHWMELAGDLPPAGLVERLLRSARTIQERSPQFGEFVEGGGDGRWGMADGGW